MRAKTSAPIALVYLHDVVWDEEDYRIVRVKLSEEEQLDLAQRHRSWAAAGWRPKTQHKVLLAIRRLPDEGIMGPALHRGQVSTLARLEELLAGLPANDRALTRERCRVVFRALSSAAEQRAVPRLRRKLAAWGAVTGYVPCDRNGDRIPVVNLERVVELLRLHPDR